MREEHPMSNAEIAQYFSNIAELLDIKGEEWYRVRAYRRAAESIAHYPEEMTTLREEGRLEEIPGVGKAIAGKIDELLQTGRMEFYQRLRKAARAKAADVALIDDVRVVPSCRRFDQWPLWKTLLLTNPLTCLLFSRRRGPWDDWYERPSR